MDNYTATELAYKNGYEQGKKDAVKHGRWENWKPPHLGMEYSYDLKACSECGFAMHNALLIPAHYCPNCGAKMDGGEA